jgi:hypothetical protein
MASFRKLWITLVDSLKPQAVRARDHAELHSIYVDTRPFNISTSSYREG